MTGLASNRSRLFPCGGPSRMSRSTTSPSCFIAHPIATCSPTKPPPITVIFLRMEPPSKSSRLAEAESPGQALACSHDGQARRRGRGPSLLVARSERPPRLLRRFRREETAPLLLPGGGHAGVHGAGLRRARRADGAFAQEDRGGRDQPRRAGCAEGLRPEVLPRLSAPFRRRSQGRPSLRGVGGEGAVRPHGRRDHPLLLPDRRGRPDPASVVPGPRSQDGRKTAGGAEVKGHRAAVPVLMAALAASTAAALEKKVDVGGFKLNLRCAGEGSPVVVLDSGAGDTSATWDWVIPDVKRFTRVCAYDRAGLGKSGAGPKPRSADRLA